MRVLLVRLPPGMPRFHRNRVPEVRVEAEVGEPCPGTGRSEQPQESRLQIINAD